MRSFEANDHTMAHDVFVSHSAKDKAAADKVVAKLEAESVRCWVAPRDVVPGADWGGSIIEAIESSRVMVLIFSQNANSSSQIKREVERAVDKEVYTIPFRIDDIKPTRTLEYFISTSQWMDAFALPLEQHLDKLAGTVKAILARPSVESAETKKPADPIQTETIPNQHAELVPHAPVWLKPVAVVAALLMLGAAWYFVSQKPQRGVRESANAVAETKAPTVASPIEKPAPVSPYAVNAAAGNEPGAANQASNDASPERPSKMGGTELPETQVPNNAPNRAAAISAPNQAASKYAVRTETPSDVVQRYYGSINRRDLTEAYDCLSRGFKAQRSMESFAKIFASTQSIQMRQLREVSRDEAKAVVTISFTETDAENRAREWDRRVSLVKEGEAWRVDGTLANQ